jgi:tRNA-splicing ligase RtcB
LEQIRAAATAVGFTPSRVYARVRQHQIQTSYDLYEFEREETAVKVSGSAFAALLVALGLPVGAKTTQDYRLPGWLLTAPLWQQRLFLAGFFGAELAAPRAFADRNHNFYTPLLSMNKQGGFVESGRQFLQDVAQLLQEFGVETKTISQRAEQVNANGRQSYRWRLVLSSRPESLINLWGKIGFEFNQKRQQLANVAVEYIKCKAQIVDKRNQAAQQAEALQLAGVAPAEIYGELVGEHVNRRFLQRSLYEGRQTSARVGDGFETFDAFCERVTQGIEGSGMVWATIAAIEPIDFTDFVYDFTVAHNAHNFIANGFVVSNCGVRLLATHLDRETIAPHLDELATLLQINCPSGVGQGGSIRLTKRELAQLVEQGGDWALKNGYATPMDLERTEENGRLAGADANKVSDRAFKRGMDQIGTLGAGNHFIEVDAVDEIFDANAAQRMGLFPGQIVVQIHCGSRGFGHQICTDYVREFQKVVHKYGIHLPDRELVCAPLSSPEGQDYLAAMKAAANYAFVNRQVLTFHIRRSFEQALAGHVKNFTVYQVYDIAHNMAKIETHEVDGRSVRVCVHRKGATRAFGPGSPVLPDVYRDIGQPVLVPGSMGTASWVLVGTEQSMAQSFGSTCHGAGRTMSRRQAKSSVRGSDLRQELEERGIHVRAGSMPGLAEEAPQAYKDVDRVIEVVHGAGIAKKVARIIPVAVIKG